MSITDKQKRAVEVGPIAISEDAFEGIADTVGYSIGYWASSADWNIEARTLMVTENAEGEYEQHTVSYDKLHETFWAIVAPDSKFRLNSTIRGYFTDSVVNGEDGDIDAGYIDGDAADALVQLAIFGEITYG